MSKTEVEISDSVLVRDEAFFNFVLRSSEMDLSLDYCPFLNHECNSTGIGDCLDDLGEEVISSEDMEFSLCLKYNEFCEKYKMIESEAERA